jgi:hypothetical protein
MNAIPVMTADAPLEPGFGVPCHDVQGDGVPCPDCHTNCCDCQAAKKERAVAAVGTSSGGTGLRTVSRAAQSRGRHA